MQEKFDFPHSLKASVIIEEKIRNNGGETVVYTLTGKPCTIFGDKSGKKIHER